MKEKVMRKVNLICLALLIAMLLVACGKQPAGQQPAAQPQGSELSIFSWWTAGGEADGLNELIKLFEAQNPGVKVVNAAVAGGAGTNAKAVLKTRMLGGDAPGTFQVHGGAELIEQWVKSGYMAPITALFDELGLRDKFPKQLLELVSHNGQIFAVPSNIHRGNALWYNKPLFDKHQITPPKTIDEWLIACKKLKAAGVTPLAIGSREKWPVTHLFEDLLLAAGGEEFYRDLFAGKIAWTDVRVKLALSTLQSLVPYFNGDHAALTWDQAAGLVQQGKAAMTVMGDWAKGYFTANGAKPNVDFGAVPTPGTVGFFVVVTDTFGLPAKAPNPQATLAFLRVVASIEGQVMFNIKKGSIPARIDAPMDQFDEIARATMADFRADKLVPSCAHGSAVVESFVTALNDQLSVFIAGANADQIAQALEAAARDTGIRQ
jgi:glucose/mannose transport system substrate-binding protein